MSADELTRIDGRLSHTLAGEPQPLPEARGCLHPRRLHRIDEWSEPMADDPRIEIVGESCTQ